MSKADNKPTRAKIKLVIVRPDGRKSEAEITGLPVTDLMMDTAEDLLYVLSFGKRRRPA